MLFYIKKEILIASFLSISKKSMPKKKDRKPLVLENNDLEETIEPKKSNSFSKQDLVIAQNNLINMAAELTTIILKLLLGETEPTI